MELSIKDISKWRSYVISELLRLKEEEGKKYVPRKIDDQKLLDRLLFDVTEIDGKIKKTFGFDPNLLYLLDLSDLSFDNVSLDYDYGNPGDVINLSGTNARVNFSKTYEYKNTSQVNVKNVNLSGLDLSFNDFGALTLEKRWIFENVDLSNTDINLQKGELKVPGVAFLNCNLSNNDFSNIELDLDNMVMVESYYPTGCNFSNTGIKCIGSKVSSVCSVIDNPNYYGCYINDCKRKLISLEDRTAIKEKVSKEYRLFEDTVLSMIKRILISQEAGYNEETVDLIHNYETFLKNIYNKQDKRIHHTFSFNPELREKIRKLIDEFLNNTINNKSSEDFYPERLSLPVSVLELALFEVKTEEDNGKKRKYKTIVPFTGYLKYLDLSKVSFDNVSYNNSRYKRKLKLNDTNANIDFSKSYEYLNYMPVDVTNIDFTNTKLSQNDLSSIAQNRPVCFYHCNLKNTDININYPYCSNVIDFTGCDLSYNNFNEVTLQNYTGICNGNESVHISPSCNLQYSGIHIDISESKNQGETINAIMDDDKYAGCHLGPNDVLILSKSERRKKLQALKDEYNEKKNALYNGVKKYLYTAPSSKLDSDTKH